MSTKKIITVLGATGSQGGSVVNALSASYSDKFSIRAVTRDPTSSKSRQLLSSGKVDEVVYGNMHDVDSLAKAFEGSYGAYVVTMFGGNMSGEIEQTRTVQQAASRAKLQHVVVSTLEDTRKIIGKSSQAASWPILDRRTGSYVPNFDGKGQAGEEFLASDVPTTLLITSPYYELLYNLGPRRTGSGYAVRLPIGTSAVPFVATSDIGRMAAALFDDPSTIGTTQGVVSQYLTGEEIASAFTNGLGKKVGFEAVDWRSFPPPFVAGFFRYYATFPPVHRDVDVVKARIGNTVELETWVRENKSNFYL